MSSVERILPALANRGPSNNEDDAIQTQDEAVVFGLLSRHLTIPPDPKDAVLDTAQVHPASPFLEGV
jgi:hypothetical protein